MLAYGRPSHARHWTGEVTSQDTCPIPGIGTTMSTLHMAKAHTGHVLCLVSLG